MILRISGFSNLFFSFLTQSLLFGALTWHQSEGLSDVYIVNLYYSKWMQFWGGHCKQQNIKGVSREVCSPEEEGKVFEEELLFIPGSMRNL